MLKNLFFLKLNVFTILFWNKGAIIFCIFWVDAFWNKPVLVTLIIFFFFLHLRLNTTKFSYIIAPHRKIGLPLYNYIVVLRNPYLVCVFSGARSEHTLLILLEAVMWPIGVVEGKHFSGSIFWVFDCGRISAHRNDTTRAGILLSLQY